jgi:hypothetical protein
MHDLEAKSGMLRHILYVSVFVMAILAETPAAAFQSKHDTEVCRKELAEFHHEASLTSVMLLKADQSTHPRSGFLRHDDVFRKRAWLRAYLSEGSDAFYALSDRATADDCRRLGDRLSKNMLWIAKYVAVRDPDRCRKYKICSQ